MSMLTIQAVNCTKELERSDFNSLLDYVSQHKKEKIQKFKRKKDAELCLLADILVRAFVINRLKLDNAQLNFDKNKYGKPYLIGFPSFHYNVSHSGDWVVAAFDSQPIGIDIEKIEPLDLQIAESICTENEFSYLITQSGPDRLSYFYKLWTLKESLTKAIGMGLSLPFNSFNICPDDQQNIISYHFKYIDWYLKQYDYTHNYSFAVCSTHNQFPDPLTMTNYQLSEMFLQVVNNSRE
ncbi:4'-phosphopantetheinyl transferase superfamily protein [Paenibacillus terrigena]|uniref:4'-phosphopantetheinyl transferase family protein n=1 Tax=Paenibacillus terrigena TaxID=369333 RepID=UPI0028D7EA20|nr:4'-phosphopantetheinyl transferase superfamily protein [Paenibacillus terrigena]